MDFDEVEIPEKLLEPKIYVRVSSEGVPQIIRVEPMFTADGSFVPGITRVYFDNVQEIQLERSACELMLLNTNCVPIEKMLNYKHRMRN